NHPLAGRDRQYEPAIGAELEIVHAGRVAVEYDTLLGSDIPDPGHLGGVACGCELLSARAEGHLVDPLARRQVDRSGAPANVPHVRPREGARGRHEPTVAAEGGPEHGGPAIRGRTDR